MSTEFENISKEIDGDYSYRVCMPEGAEPKYIHVHAFGANDFSEDVSYILDGDRNKDTMYLLLHNYGGKKAIASGEKYAKLIEDLSEQYNIPVSNISIAGFSMGSNVGASTFASLVEDGYDVPFYVHMSANSSGVTLAAYKRVAEVYKDRTDTPPFIYIRDGTNSDERNLFWAKKEWPGDIIEFYNSAGSHNCDYQYIENNLVGFLNGTASLSNFNIYDYVKVYTLDENGNRIEKKFETLEEFEEYFLKFKGFLSPALSLTALSNEDLVEYEAHTFKEYINNIKFSVKNSGILSESLKAAYESQSRVPLLVSEKIKKYMEVTNLFLGKIASDMLWIESAGDSLEGMDAYLKKRLDEINHPNDLEVSQVAADTGNGEKTTDNMELV